MLNKHQNLSDADILFAYEKTKKLMNLSSFNNRIARQKYQYDLCMLEAQIIKRKLTATAN